MLTYLKGVLARTKALLSKPPRKPKLAVIDDSGMIQRVVERNFESSHEVTCFYRIPNNLDELKPFDVLVVDNDGIGNGKFVNGMDFLRKYVPFLLEEKRIVHFTGLCEFKDKMWLKSVGVAVVDKGGRPEELVNAVNGAKED